MSSLSFLRADFYNWSSSNVQLLHGSGFKLGPSERTTVTLEHAFGWDYGDFFGFLDIARLEGGGDTVYGELTPRLSLSALTGRDLSSGLIKDVLISTQFERGERGLARYLGGLAVDLKLEGFKFFKVNLYYRHNPDRQDDTYQFYIAWNRPFELGGAKLLFEGFADIYGEEGGSTVSAVQLQPRLLVDIGEMLQLGEGRLHTGLEWIYWNNKFGLDGIEESVPQFQLKYRF